MKKLMNVLLLSCKKASELIDKSTLVKLSTKERVMLRMHTRMCDACSLYKKQSKMMDGILEDHLSDGHEDTAPQAVNDDLKKKIISRL